ncbi:MAG: hypothetical protein QN196_05815, partial [Armatimonadota bacterium]|nr:hypothetical protein [Armatimonadota bacterium]
MRVLEERERVFSVVGQRLPRVDGWAKVSGRAQYTDDLTLPGMLFGKLVRSTHAHARLVSVRLERALKVPGVVAAITGRDVPVRYSVFPVGQDETALAV